MKNRTESSSLKDQIDALDSIDAETLEAKLAKSASLTVEYDATIYEKIWLTNDKAFFDRIMSKKYALPMMAPELVKNFTPVYLVGVLRDKQDRQDGDAIQEK